MPAIRGRRDIIGAAQTVSTLGCSLWALSLKYSFSSAMADLQVQLMLE